jgi:hypothetical protein
MAVKHRPASAHLTEQDKTLDGMICGLFFEID